MSDAEIRPARLEEAEVLAALGRTTFIDTFIHEFGIPYPPEDLAAYMDASFSAEATRKRLLDSSQVWWTASIDGEIVGFANAGPNTLPHADARASHAELRRLYIAKRAQGRGIGTRLLTTALTWMEAHTDGPLWIGVWSGNLKAQRLYAGYGFTKAGEYKYPVGTWYDDEFILRRG
ncbi:MAG: GNAT family N-acetyltransferase [Myxococcales bacterium 68-20]|nr:GNAT family N-acetyltransferase [Myxococcales bacterium]OJY25078.1 MAG: GNAT family N-acetyltransferase [Myxococcales bacterium 68-20]